MKAKFAALWTIFVLTLVSYGRQSWDYVYDGHFTIAAKGVTSDVVIFTRSGLGSGTLTTRGATATLDVTVVVGDGQTMLAGMRTVTQQAQAAGATRLVINTGEVVDQVLAQALAQRAASGQGFLGGTVQATGTSAAGNPTFQIIKNIGGK